MEKRKVVKSVSFNTSVEDEAKILRAVKRRNFSKYVKACLLADINRREQEKASPTPYREEVVEKVGKVEKTQQSPANKLEEMKRQMKKTGSNPSSPKLF